MTDPTTTLESPAAPSRRGAEHFVQFYEDDGCLVDAVSDYLGTALEGGSAGILVAAPDHRTPVTQRLQRRGIDLGAMSQEGRFVSLDAAHTMSRFMVDGEPTAARFGEVLGPVLDAASDGGRRPVRVFGEMVALLWADGRRQAAVQVEKLWSEMGRRKSFSLFCAYPMRAFPSEGDGQSFLEICAEHGHARPTESFTRLSTEEERMAAVTQLQQKALALDGEIARRRELEETLARREKELFEVLQNAQEGVVDVDGEGRVEWANVSHLAHVGYPADAYFGSSLVDLLGDRRAYDEVWGRLLRGERVQDVDVELRRADGSTASARIHSATLRVLGRSVHMRWFVRWPTPAPAPAQLRKTTGSTSRRRAR